MGQVRLQRAWDAALRRQGLEGAQILLSAGDLAERASYVNVRNALETLLKLGVVPVVNENDATATDEITFGDNDALAAQVAVLVRARLLVLLTEVEGVYTSHPAEAGAELLAEGDTAGRLSSDLERRSAAAGWRARSPRQSSQRRPVSPA